MSERKKWDLEKVQYCYDLAEKCNITDEGIWKGIECLAKEFVQDYCGDEYYRDFVMCIEGRMSYLWYMTEHCGLITDICDEDNPWR